MNIISESNYENNIIEQLKLKGFQYLSQQEILKLRNNNLNEVIIRNFLEKAIRRNNPNVTQDEINKIILKLNDLKGSDLISGNLGFQKYINEGIKIRNSKTGKTNTFKIFDMEDKNNEWIVTNQFVMNTDNPMYNKQYPDIVVYCNGLPVIVMELKNVNNDENNLSKAFNQIKNYQLYLKDLFVYNFFNIIDNFSEAKFGSITSTLKRYQYWRGPDFSSDSQMIYSDLFSQGKILKLVNDFTFFTDQKTPVKIIASYHQYYGVLSAIESTLHEIVDKNRKGNGKAGIFWHTQGSGKSFSMLFLTRNIARLIPGTTFLVVTDRNDLDNQLFKTFKSADTFINQKIHQIESIKNLKEELKGRTQDGVYFTTIQKFSEDVKELSNRDNILIITDEAHRSHTNIDGKIDPESLNEKFGNARYLRNAFPKATFIGFTGTPIENDDKSTQSIFGKIITRYLMSHAERDGVVVPIRYESRKATMIIEPEAMAKLNDEVEKTFEEIDRNSLLPDEARKKINKSLQKIENIITDPDRIQGVAKDFVTHYKERSQYLNGKAMFVAFNRHVAFDYYKKIIELAPDLKKHIKLIITANGQNDSPELLELAGNSNYRRQMANEFKNPDSDFKIAIVVDMWLTGFDVPALDVVYLDKPVKMHNLMQTIARTNRVYEGKEYGLVVDFIGLWKKLNEALSAYTNKEFGETTKERDVSELKEIYIEKVNKLYEYFDFKKYVNISELIVDDQKRIKAVREMSGLIFKNRTQQEYTNKTKNVSTWLKEIISITNKEERLPFQLLMVVRSNIIKTELGQLDLTDKTSQLKELLKSVLKFKETEVVNSVEGNAIELSKIIKFINEDVDEENPDFDLAMKIAALRKGLQKSKDINAKKSNNLMSKLDEMLKRYENNYVSMDELLKMINGISDELSKMDRNQKNESGFSEKEMAFYNIVKQPVDDLPEFDRKKIKEITKDLLKIINDDEKVNATWKYNNQAINKVRAELTILLDNHNYPPSKEAAKEIVDQVMHQKNIRRN